MIEEEIHWALWGWVCPTERMTQSSLGSRTGLPNGADAKLCCGDWPLEVRLPQCRDGASIAWGAQYPLIEEYTIN